MKRSALNNWLQAWGYNEAHESLFKHSISPSVDYAYRNEIEKIFDPEGSIRASAVFDVDGVPTVCFIEDNGRLINDRAGLDRIREKIWNQNLISIILVVSESDAFAVPVIKRDLGFEKITWSQASKTGLYSIRDIQSGHVFRRHADWFAQEDRVDRDLLRNLERIVKDLVSFGLDKVDAQYLMAQVLFISYLEHRDIVGDTYRQMHNLGHFANLIRAYNRKGIKRLLAQLKQDFNGDFLEPEKEESALWDNLSDRALSRLCDFLERVNLKTGQKSLWHYDFSFIPVELISGIYESFLSDDRREAGAYYTSRHLANFVVDQAFASSIDILAERIYDGACGSGILLTTAYRRMLSFAEAKRGQSLKFNERSDLLKNHIFGSDINKTACRVTAFSLYLSLLEGLQPSDIAELQDNEDVKLPSLGRKNILGGDKYGDFFSDQNMLAVSKSFSIFLSNPPWVEPKGSLVLSSDSWAKFNEVKIPRRNTAGAFMLRARDSLALNGRICLILPASIVAASTSKNFIKKWLEFYRIETLVNFGDLRRILFNSAKQPCVVVVGRPRPESSIGNISGNEIFEYWVPKADVSFAFGRLTLHSSDRHFLQTNAIRQDSELLTSLFWGTAQDVATISELRLMGRLDDFIGKYGNWHIRKGFHRYDATVNEPVSVSELRNFPFLDANAFDGDRPVLDENQLGRFPSKIESVASLPDDLLKAFKAPKIIFTDGLTNNRKIRAAFSKKAFSFSSSIGVIYSQNNDELLLRFVAAYLHSNLCQYILLLTAYQVNFERERVSLYDIRKLPFIHPDKHPKKEHAWKIIQEVFIETVALEKHSDILSRPYNSETCESLIFEYFGLKSHQKNRVLEVAKIIAPNIQPNSVLNIGTPLQRRPLKSQIAAYSKSLRRELLYWRKTRGGKGDITVEIKANSKSVVGPLGIVKIQPTEKDARNPSRNTKTILNDQAVESLINRLITDGLLPIQIQRNMHLATDMVVHVNDTIYIVKPLVSRFWLYSEAFRDSERIVNSILSSRYNEEAHR